MESSENELAPDKVSSIRIYPSNLYLTVGKTYELSAILGDSSQNVLPVRKINSSEVINNKYQAMHVIGDEKGRTGLIVNWKSSKPDIVKVEENGLVTALSTGTSIITASNEDIKEEATVTVTKSNDALLSLNPVSARLSVGDTLQLTANLQDNNKDNISAPISWIPDDPAKVKINNKGLVTAISSGKVKITVKSENKQGQAELAIIPVKKIYGLDFPGNAGVNKTMRFEFNSPPPAYPATYIWRVYPRQQKSYYTAFFWGNNGPFFGSNTYYGFHPYPDWASAHQHFWEIASPPGRDFVSRQHVVYDRWYTQVAVCTQSKDKTMEEFYWDWPNLTRVIRHIGKKYNPPPVPALIVGDAPWNQGNEVWYGVIRGFQFYDTALTLKEVAQEIVSPGKIKTPWYLNLNPTPEDISDKITSKHNPSWVGSERPSLWSGEIIDRKVIRTVKSY